MELSWSVGFLSVWINPVIHFVVNQNFREFTVNKIKTILDKILMRSERYGNHGNH